MLHPASHILQPNHHRASRDGQAMIIAVLSLGGAILGATALAGFLTLYTIRSGTDYRNSASAIFAADSGVNWSLYADFHPVPPLPTFANGATVNVTCTDASGVGIGCSNPSATAAISVGTSQKVHRAFSLDLSSATTTVP